MFAYGYEVQQLPGLVTAARVQTITGTIATVEQIEAAVAVASATIRNYCNWHVAPSLSCTYHTECSGYPELQLPAVSVSAVDSVKVNGEAVEFVWKPNGRIMRKNGEPWPREWGSVEVKYSAGVDASQLEFIAAKLSAAALASPAGVRSESIGSASVTYASTGIDDAFGENMKALCASYKLPWRP